jgi:predicted DNA-binding WGR domain protein
VGVRIDADRPSSLVVDRKATDAAPREGSLREGSATAQPPRTVRKRFEREENGVRHFWEIEVVGARHRVVSGTFTDDEDGFESSEEALEALEREIAARLKEGFEEVGPRTKAAAPKSDATSASAPAATNAGATSTPTTTAATTTAPGTSSTTATASTSATTTTSASTSASGTRRFELVEGSSRKFWEVSVQGTELVTRYGRLGTNGQSTTKAFPSPEAAGKARDQLVAEKTSKGYRAVD